MNKCLVHAAMCEEHKKGFLCIMHAKHCMQCSGVYTWSVVGVPVGL